MKCPNCGQNEHRVLETRDRDQEIRRRRECHSCKFRFTTIETLLMHYPHVVKKDGRREPFSKEKLRHGIQMACKKRPVSVSQVESLVNRISRWVQHSPEREMAAQKIGGAVINELKMLDDVAFVRFASVYKNFRNVQEFVLSLDEKESPKKESKWDKEDNLEN
jgi:transcriptional repressor NrdR